MKNVVAKQISTVDIALFLLTTLFLQHVRSTTPTFESCRDEAGRLNRTFTFSGFSEEDMDLTTEDISAVPRLDAIGLGIHRRAKRAAYPLMAAYSARREKRSVYPLLASYVTRRPFETDEVRNLSLCPWTLTADTNNTRIPNQLYKAECHHDNGNNQCNLDIPGLPARGPQVNRFIEMLMNKIECNVVYTSVEVAYECCSEGAYSLRKEWEEWPVACTCSRRKIRIGQTIPINGR